MESLYTKLRMELFGYDFRPEIDQLLDQLPVESSEEKEKTMRVLEEFLIKEATNRLDEGNATNPVLNFYARARTEHGQDPKRAMIPKIQEKIQSLDSNTQYQMPMRFMTWGYFGIRGVTRQDIEAVERADQVGLEEFQIGDIYVRPFFTHGEMNFLFTGEETPITDRFLETDLRIMLVKHSVFIDQEAMGHSAKRVSELEGEERLGLRCQLNRMLKHLRINIEDFLALNRDEKLLVLNHQSQLQRLIKNGAVFEKIMRLKPEVWCQVIENSKAFGDLLGFAENFDRLIEEVWGKGDDSQVIQERLSKLGSYPETVGCLFQTGLHLSQIEEHLETLAQYPSYDLAPLISRVSFDEVMGLEPSLRHELLSHAGEITPWLSYDVSLSQITALEPDIRAKLVQNGLQVSQLLEKGISFNTLTHLSADMLRTLFKGMNVYQLFESATEEEFISHLEKIHSRSPATQFAKDRELMEQIDSILNLFPLEGKENYKMTQRLWAGFIDSKIRAVPPEKPYVELPPENEIPVSHLDPFRRLAALYSPRHETEEERRMENFIINALKIRLSFLELPSEIDKAKPRIPLEKFDLNGISIGKYFIGEYEDYFFTIEDQKQLSDIQFDELLHGQGIKVPRHERQSIQEGRPSENLSEAEQIFLAKKLNHLLEKLNIPLKRFNEFPLDIKWRVLSYSIPILFITQYYQNFPELLEKGPALDEVWKNPIPVLRGCLEGHALTEMMPSLESEVSVSEP